MKKSLIMLPLLFAAAACGQKSDTESRPSSEMAAPGAATEAAASDSAGTAPNIDTSVTPGVAFDFRYQFALASERIGGVQEEHAQACKKLGIAKCRVTGMDYRASGTGDIAAMLAFKVAPDVATDFTRDAKRIVEQAEGELTNANLTGTDLGSNIAIAEANEDEIRAELATIQKQIETTGLSKDVRARLVEQAAALREQLRNIGQSKNADRTALAMTPVVFEYETAHGIPGFDGQSPFAGAAAVSISSFIAMLKFLMIAIGVLAPWALFGGAIFWAVRRLRTRTVPAVSSPEQA